MRRSITGLAAAAVVFATPAMARDDSWYIEADAGATWVRNLDIAIENSAIDTKTGYDIGAIVGYDFGKFRLEAEASYRRAPIDKVVEIGGPASFALDGNASDQSFMLNGLLDFGKDDGLQFFVGAGAGIGKAKLEWLLGSPGTLVGDSDWDFAWQGWQVSVCRSATKSIWA
jgi:OOP family OmpA-OmpF porin